MAGDKRTRKRSASVCDRCRRQKIKCSGSQPCQGCEKRGMPCIFNNMDQKVLVTRRYIAELQQKIALIEKDGKHVDFSNGPSKELVPADQGVGLDTVAGNEMSSLINDTGNVEQVDDSEPELINPLAADPPTFMSPGNGRIFYLGTSSNWSFTRRLLSLTHQHLYGEPLPTESLIFEGDSYDLDWDGWRTSQVPADPVIPSLDHALHLINTVKFRCGQLYHLRDDKNFMESLHEFYSQDSPPKEKSLWYIHFLLIMAFGKSFLQPKSQDHKSSGTKYFVKALQLLPDHHVLYSSPMISTEILCCIALFYQSLDYRSPAHNYVGQAMRMAMAHGMHTMHNRMPVGELGLNDIERCRNIWWTVYILDRHMSSIQGLPQSIDDRLVQTSLPSSSHFPERDRNTALDMHVKLCRGMADINSTVYGVDGRINRKFLLSTKAALSNIAEHADKLCETFALHLDGKDHGISRTFAYLHLLYQQCVIVATRPLLFCFLKIRLDSPEACAELLKKWPNVRNLIQMCVESAQYSVRILHGLKSQGLLETFLSLDLESVFISTVVLLVGAAIDPVLLDGRLGWLEQCYAIFQDMVEATNKVAKFRWLELRQLENTLNSLHQGESPVESTQNVLSRQPDAAQLFSAPLSYVPTIDPNPCNDVPFFANSAFEAEYGLCPVFTTAEMMEMADSIETHDAEWMSSAMMNHDIW